MKASAGLAAAAFLTVSLVGCSKERTSSALPESVHITLSATAVVANGTNTVTVTLTDPAGGPISVTTDHGTFPGGGQTATIAAATGSLALRTCDAASAGCAGTVRVTATGAGGTTAWKTLTFGSVATACATSCSADAACAGRTCTPTAGGTGTCSSTSPSACIAVSGCTKSPAGATTETSCTDGLDNDCSGAVDGADASCEGQPCDAAAPSRVWVGGACTDQGSQLGIQVTAAKTRLAPGGTTTVVVRVTSGSAPAPGVPVSVSTTRGTISPASGPTGADGTATFTFTNAATAGVATITGSVTAQPALSQTATVTTPKLGSFQLAAVQLPVMGAKGSGWNELGWVQIQVQDEVGLPYPDGLAVTFEHRPLGGSTLDPLAAATATCVAPACVLSVGTVSSGEGVPSGLAQTMIHSGTVAGTLVVTATATADGITITAPLPTMTVVGAKASGSSFSVVCGPRNVPALAETDCSISLVDAPFTCEALLKDRFDNALGTETQVMFVAEAAATGHVTTTPQYVSGGDSTGLGVAVQQFSTLGAGLPFDVLPDAAASEPSVIDAFGVDGCGPRTRNPRDGVVTVVAIADGEEAFFDANGNGSYDALEPFVDQGEPFVDQNDNGVRDAGEWFLDVDGNRAYTGANGTWDASAKLWTQTVVVYTGQAARLASGAGFVGTRWADLPLASACTPSANATPFDLAVAVPPAPGESKRYAVVASDLNLNFLTSDTSYGATVEDAADVKASYAGLAAYADELGFFYRYWPCANGGAGACASQCRATGGTYPCVMKPALSAYSCGFASTVTVTGGTKPVPSAIVDWTVDVPWQVYLTGKTQHAVSGLGGKTH